jgi:hypothetical protein
MNPEDEAYLDALERVELRRADSITATVPLKFPTAAIFVDLGAIFAGFNGEIGLGHFQSSTVMAG